MSFDGQTPSVAKIRWDLLDAHLAKQGELHPVRPGISIDNDTTRKLKRQARGLFVPSDEAVEVDEFTDRLQPWWIEDDGTEHPLGVFMYADVNRIMLWTPDAVTLSTLEATLTDQLVILDQPLQHGISFRAGTNLTTMQRSICDMYGQDADIDSSGLACSTPMTWLTGRDTGLDALIDIGKLGAFYDPYYNNAGRLQIRVSPSTASADWTVAPESIKRGSWVESTDVLKAANVFLAIESGSTATPLVGTYEIPADEPNSRANRGFAVVSSEDHQGIAGQSAADDMARSDSTLAAFRSAAVDIIPDPRRDTYEIVDLMGALYLDQKWTLPLDPAGDMSHTPVRIIL